jgi:hypothetical protein
MRRYLLALTFLGLAALEAPGRAAADTITYVETATASGTLDGVAFTNQTLTLTGVGIQAAVVDQGHGGYGNPVALTASVGATTDQLLGTPSAQSSQIVQIFGFFDSGGADILSTSAPAYATYDLTTAIGPVVGSFDSSFATPLRHDARHTGNHVRRRQHHRDGHGRRRRSRALQPALVRHGRLPPGRAGVAEAERPRLRRVVPGRWGPGVKAHWPRGGWWEKMTPRGAPKSFRRCPP